MLIYINIPVKITSNIRQKFNQYFIKFLDKDYDMRYIKYKDIYRLIFLYTSEGIIKVNYKLENCPKGKSKAVLGLVYSSDVRFIDLQKIYNKFTEIINEILVYEVNLIGFLEYKVVKPHFFEIINDLNQTSKLNQKLKSIQAKL